METIKNDDFDENEKNENQNLGNDDIDNRNGETSEIVENSIDEQIECTENENFVVGKDVNGNYEITSFNGLPPLLQSVCDSFNHSEKELMLFSTLTVFSGIFPNVSSIYLSKKIKSNLFLYIIGSAGSGKGNASWAHKLISKVDKTTSIDLNVLKQFNLSINLTDVYQLTQKLTIPANNSAAGFLELFNDNGGRGIIFETEGDTISNAFKMDSGDYSDILRKAFHHEPITQYRKGNNKKQIQIDFPELSVIITSTVGQFMKIIPNAENGLFSRFIINFTQNSDKFLNVFDKETNNREILFNDLSQKVFETYQKFNVADEIIFKLTLEQEVKFVEYFSYTKSTLTNLIHEDLASITNRTALMSYRIMMILSIFRNESNDVSAGIVCSNQDFNIALNLSKIILQNSAYTMTKILSGKELDSNKFYRKCYDALPNGVFKTQDAKSILLPLGMPERTTDEFLKKPFFEKVKHGFWKKNKPNDNLSQI